MSECRGRTNIGATPSRYLRERKKKKRIKETSVITQNMPEKIVAEVFTAPPYPSGMTLFVSVAVPDPAADCQLGSPAVAPLDPLTVLILALGHARTPAHSSPPDRHTSLSFPSVP